ncbi:MAG: DUF308 domain-containing protein [Oscillospiraceae bacterium]|nr:DUF308 domain-containing protein [Oscillospiraceae bacterium]
MKAGKIITIILGIVMIATGIYCLFTPAMTYLSVGYVVGINMVLDAIGGIIAWSERKKSGSADGWELAGAIASLVFGIILLGSAAMQLVVDMVIVYIAAAWLVVIGAIRIVRSTKLRKFHKVLDTEILGKRWWAVMLTGILLVVCGVLSFANPTGLMIAIGVNFGINIIAAGVSLITTAA